MGMPARCRCALSPTLAQQMQKCRMNELRAHAPHLMPVPVPVPVPVLPCCLLVCVDAEPRLTSELHAKATTSNQRNINCPATGVNLPQASCPCSEAKWITVFMTGQPRTLDAHFRCGPAAPCKAGLACRAFEDRYRWSCFQLGNTQIHLIRKCRGAVRNCRRSRRRSMRLHLPAQLFDSGQRERKHVL